MHLTRDKDVCQKHKKRNQDYINEFFSFFQCKKEFHHERQLMDHKKRDHNFILVKPTNYEELDKTIITMMETFRGTGKYSCKRCGKNTNDRRNMIIRIETNHIEGVYHPCKPCGNMFRSRESLN